MGCGICEGALSGLIGGIIYLVSFVVSQLIELLAASTYFLLGKIRMINLNNTTRPAKPKVI